MMPAGTAGATCDYSNLPLAATMAQVVDYDVLNQPNGSGVQLCLGLTDVAAGELVFLDNRKTRFGMDHLMATAAEPGPKVRGARGPAGEGAADRHDRAPGSSLGDVEFLRVGLSRRRR